jgi:thiol-disulfide isomerase/thioredoxin
MKLKTKVPAKRTKTSATLLGEKTLVVFSSADCAPCREQKKVIAKFSDAHPSVSCRVVMLDSAAGEKEAKKILGKAIQAVPTLAILKGKTVLRQSTGLMNVKELEAFCDP